LHRCVLARGCSSSLGDGHDGTHHHLVTLQWFTGCCEGAHVETSTGCCEGAAPMMGALWRCIIVNSTPPSSEED
jgi:hypothetical protein